MYYVIINRLNFGDNVVASEKSFPKLSAVQSTKLRHLTIVTLAIKNKVCLGFYVNFCFVLYVYSL